MDRKLLERSQSQEALFQPFALRKFILSNAFQLPAPCASLVSYTLLVDAAPCRTWIHTWRYVFVARVQAKFDPMSAYNAGTSTA